MNATHQRKVLLMNSRIGELYNVEGVITSIMFSSYYYLYINLLETQLRTSLGILGDIIVMRFIIICFIFINVIISISIQLYKCYKYISYIFGYKFVSKWIQVSGIHSDKNLYPIRYPRGYRNLCIHCIHGYTYPDIPANIQVEV